MPSEFGPYMLAGLRMRDEAIKNPSKCAPRLRRWHQTLVGFPSPRVARLRRCEPGWADSEREAARFLVRFCENCTHRCAEPFVIPRAEAAE